MAAQLRGHGVALFREEVTKGMAHAVQELAEQNLDPSLVYCSMWTEAIKHFAEQARVTPSSWTVRTRASKKKMQQMLAMQHLDRPGGPR